MSPFRRKRRKEAPEDVYEGLRGQVLGLTPGELPDAIPDDAPILALLMETRYPEAVATLVAVADGTTSLYLSTGGGVIGAGEHEAVAEASRRWLLAAEELLGALSPTPDPPLPGPGLTRFVAVTPRGLLDAEAPEAELEGGRHPLSPLYHAGDDVLTQVRLVSGG
jgi:hypothetical protein